MRKFIEEKGGFDKFVMKPQREGGANNFYGDQIAKQIEEKSEAELGAFILMDKIYPEERLGIYTDFKAVYVTNVVSEIGIYGAAVYDADGN